MADIGVFPEDFGKYPNRICRCDGRNQIVPVSGTGSDSCRQGIVSELGPTYKKLEIAERKIAGGFVMPCL